MGALTLEAECKFVLLAELEQGLRKIGVSESEVVQVANDFAVATAGPNAPLSVEDIAAFLIKLSLIKTGLVGAAVTSSSHNTGKC